MDDRDPPPLNFNLMYISSTDTLCGAPIDQKIKQGWNDHPPLFMNYQQQKSTLEDDLLLKGMIRDGIPPALRCAVYMSNVVNACHPHQENEYSKAYRTLGKVRLLDRAWETVVAEIFPDESDLRDAIPPTFGNTDSLSHHSSDQHPVSPQGSLALTHVLCAVEHIIGLDYCPLLPPLAGLFLRYLSESYTFCALREIVQNPSWYFPTTQLEHYAWCQAFGSVLERLHPQTAASMRASGFFNIQDAAAEGMSPIFKQFFLPILPYDDVLRILDIYTFEGHKVLFRFGIALLVLFKKNVVRDDMVIATPDLWWWQLREYTQNSDMYSFNLLCKKAYGYHGNRARKRLRFPRRHILTRILKMEQDKAANNSDIHFETLDTAPRPLGLIENGNIKLAKSAQYRAHLAAWLPPTLRLTKLDLVYSTEVHGRTIDLFYRHVKNIKHTILLAQVLDNDAIIGFFASQAWRQSNQVYGDGECFLFRLNPDAQCWKWKPDNTTRRLLDDEDDESSLEENHKRSLLEQFMVGREHFISMGGNDGGGSGFRLNEDLTKGESSTANGFHNEPLPMISNFEVGIIEVYQLARAIDGKTAAQANAEAFHRTM